MQITPATNAAAARASMISERMVFMCFAPVCVSCAVGDACAPPGWLAPHFAGEGVEAAEVHGAGDEIENHQLDILGHLRGLSFDACLRLAVWLWAALARRPVG